jgi:hypothetical protein
VDALRLELIRLRGQPPTEPFARDYSWAV